MPKFTPGPWAINKWSNTHGKPKFEIGQIYTGKASHSNTIFWIAGVGAPDESEEIAKANACLISAAPELYKSLKKLLQLIAEGELIEKEVSHYIPLLVEEAWLALAKAEGTVEGKVVD